MKTPNMEKSKEESVILLSMDKPTENNNTLENGDLHPFEYEKKLELKNGELQTFDIEKTMKDGAKIKSKSRMPLIVAWTCVGCALAFATIALIVIFTRQGSTAPPVPHNETTTISSTITTPSQRPSIKPSPTSSIPTTTVSRTLATLQPSSSSTLSPSVSVTPSLTSMSPTSSVSISSSVTSSETLSDSPTIPVISTSPVMKSTSVLVSPTKSTVIPTSLSNNPVTTATVTVEITTPRPGCSFDEFQCSSGQCISKNLTCDGEAQCYDLSDETNCSNCHGFECNSGLCLWTSSFRCNDRVDCPDLSDEIGCPWRRGYEECDNGLYVHRDAWCDGIDDCFDNSDEKYCDGECHLIGEKLCPDGKTCVLHEWWCDGHFDCPGGGDEEHCGTCSSDQWQCSDHTCISKDAVCNGVIDCPSQDDEADCLGFKDSGNSQQTSGLVLVHPQGHQLPVCSLDWSQELSDTVCQYLGFESSNGYSTVSDPGSQAYMVIDTSRDNKTPSQNETVLALLKKMSTCSTHKVLSVSCSPKVCGEKKASYLTSFIVGGTLSPPGKWPWVVSISYLGKDTCGGVLVADNWVLTAAHCIVPVCVGPVRKPHCWFSHEAAQLFYSSGSYNYTSLPYNFEVTAGTVYRQRSRTEDNVNDGSRQMVKVKKIIVHPNTVKLVTGIMDWDMALLQLSKPVLYGEYVQPVCLPSQDESFPTKSQCFLAGWGFINPQQETVNELREAKMRLWGDTDCATNTVNGESHVNVNSTMCAGYTYGIISACQGDSGGPLMCSDTRGHWTVAGVMSSGSDGCDGEQFYQANRFARVSSASDWIYSVIQPS